MNTSFLKELFFGSGDDEQQAPPIIVSLFILVLALLLGSCGNQEYSGNRTTVKSEVVKSPTARFRAKETWFSNYTYSYYNSKAVEIIEVDSAYKAGDTMELKIQNGYYERTKTYILLEKVD